ncbi:mitochondrial ATP synthase g subunit-domain-containing protein [Lyophyllum atratum]|nr:mitochondrial ATP synthase g subunit-domain-containing protein [Lyophyllum atratum]
MRPVLPTTLRSTLIRRTPTKARFASTNPSVEAAQEKAKEALGSVQKNAGKVWEGTLKFLGPAGQRIGNALGAYREPLMYNLSVARHFVKHIYRTEHLQPPSLSTVQEAYKTMWSRAKDPNYWREAMRTGEIKQVGIYAVEAFGLFKIGEIIGRRSLVGYKLD